MLWSAVGIIVGPFVGTAAAAVVGRRVIHAALGAGVLADVLVADGIYGLTVVGSSTSPVYWICAWRPVPPRPGSPPPASAPLPPWQRWSPSTAVATGVLSLGHGVLNAVH